MDHSNLYIIFSGKSPLPDPTSEKDHYYFSLDEAMMMKEHYEKVLKEQLREEKLGSRRDSLTYLLLTLRIEKAMVH